MKLSRLFAAGALVVLGPAAYMPAAGARTVPAIVQCAAPKQAMLCLSGGKPWPAYGASFYDGSTGRINTTTAVENLARAQALDIVRANSWMGHQASVSATVAVPGANDKHNTYVHDLDEFVAHAEAAGLYVMLDLSDFRKVLESSCINPFDPSSVPYWKRLIGLVLNHVNPFVAGARAYKDDPHIAFVYLLGDTREAGHYDATAHAWQDHRYWAHSPMGNGLGGDPADASGDSLWGDNGQGGTNPCVIKHPTYLEQSDFQFNGSGHEVVSSRNLTRTYEAIDAYTKMLAPHRLLIPGGLGKLDEYNGVTVAGADKNPYDLHGGIRFDAIFSDPNVDVCGFKTYGAMVDWLNNGISYCSRSLHRPSVDTEFGYKMGTSNPTTRCDLIDDPSGHNYTWTDAARADCFLRTNRVLANDGAAGVFFWNSGNHAGDLSYDVDTGSAADLQTFCEVHEDAPGPPSPAAGCPRS